MPSSPRPTPLILLLLLGTASAEAADLRFAHGLYRDKRYALAAEEYKKFLDENPNDAKADEARYFLGETCVQLQKLDAAADAYEAVTTSDKTYRMSALFRSGTVRKRLGDPAKAQRAFERYVGEFPDGVDAPTAWLLLADCRLALNQTEGAQVALRNARKTIDEGSKWWGRLQLTEADLNRALGRSDASIETLRALADSRDPLAPDASLRLGAILFDEKKFSEASTAFGRTAAATRDAAVARRANYNAGLCFLELKNWAEASRLLGEVFSAGTSESSPEAIDLAAQAGEALVQAKRRSGDRAAARSVIDEALRRFRGSKAIWAFQRLSAEVDLDEGRAAEAATTLKRLLRDSPGDAERAEIAAAACRAAAATGDAAWAAALLKELPEGDARTHAERSLSEADWKDIAAAQSVLRFVNDAIGKARLTYRIASLEIESSKISNAVTRLQSLRRNLSLPPDLRMNVDYLLGGGLVQQERWAEAIVPLEAYLQGVLGPSPSTDQQSVATAARWWARCLTWLSDADAQKRLEPFLVHNNRSLFETIAASFAAERRAELSLWLLARLPPPESRSAAATAARCLLELKRPQEALARLPNPSTPEEFYLAGVARLQLGDAENLAAARTLLERVADADPPTPWSIDAALRLARAAKTAPEVEETERRLTRLASAARGPELRRLRLETAFLAAASGKALQAIADLKTFIEQESASPEAVEAALKLADLHESRGEAAQAREALDKAEQLDAVRQASGPLLFRRAALAYRNKDWPKAESLLSEFVSKFPSDDARGDASLMLAEIALEQRRADEAVQRFMALKTSPDATTRATVTLRLAQALLLAKKFDEAERTANEFLSLQGQPAGRVGEARFVLGRALMNRAKFEQARAAFEAVGADEANELGAKTRFMIAETYFHQKRYDPAVKEYLKVVVLGKDDGWRAAAGLQVGKCHESMNDLRAAAEDYRRVIDQFPAAPAALQAKERLQEIQLGARNSERNGVKE